MSDFCKDCFKGFILPGEAKGKMETIGSLSVYVAEPTGFAGEPRTDVAVLYACDAFGLGLINNKIIPDRLADALGCTVYVPDLLEGDYPPPDIHSIDEPMGKKSIFFRMSQYMKLIGSMLFGLGPRWIIRHSRGKMQPLTEAFAKALKEEKKLQRICALGHCMGGVQSCALAGSGLVDVAVIAHPGPLARQDFEKINVPVSFICAEEDFTFSNKARQMAEEVIKKNNVTCEFRIYDGTTHGFAARPNMGIPVVKQAFNDAFDQAVNWITIHLLSPQAPA